jgi:hypothetical protein
MRARYKETMAEERNKRPYPISVRATPEQREQIERNAAVRGMSRNAFMLHASLNKRDPRVSHEAIGQLAVIGAEIRDELRRISADHPDADVLRTVQVQSQNIDDIRSALMELAGRRS